MAYSGSQNIDPALRQNSLTSPPKGRDAFQNGAQPAYSPLQPSPNNSYQGLQTPNYYGNQPTQDSPDEQSPAENPNDPNDLKRPRACEACRQLKVKCEPDDNNPTGSCKRCAKASRQCVVTAPSRKRQKKTDSRVAELEKKIDALTATLAARGGSETDVALDPAITQSHPPPAPHRGPIYPEQWSAAPQPPPMPHHSPPNNPHGVKRKTPGPYSDYFGGELHKSSTPAAKSAPAPPYPAMFSTDIPKPRQTSDDQPMIDVIDQGVLDVGTAKRCFERYLSEMCYHLPIVVFPPNTKSEDVRRNKPTLFLVILAVASGTIRPDVQPKLINEATKILADRVMNRGEKSLELVQAIQLMTLFYQPPEKYEEMNFNQLIHIAAVMALDIGMGKRFRKGNLALWRPFTEQKKTLPDPNSSETRRCWLGCYFMCSNSAMSLRRPLLIRWGPYADECLEILQNAPDAAPTDKWLCLLVRGQHIAEEIGFEFSMDDPASQLSLTDHKTQYHLKAFERQLAEWHDSATKEMLKKPIMQHTEGIINLYMHEIAMHHNHNIDDFRPPFNATPIDGPPDPDFVTPAHIESLTTCLHSVHAVFDAFLSMDTKFLRALPTLFFVRNSYAAVALIKMYTTVSAKGSKFGAKIQTEDLKVDYYLDRLIESLTKTAEGGMCRVAYKFSLIFNMLKQWHVKRTDPHSGDASNPISRQRTPANAKGGPPEAYKAVPPQQDPAALGWNTQGRGSVDHTPHQAHQQQSRSGLQMLSDAAMGPGPPPLGVMQPQPPLPTQQHQHHQQSQQQHQHQNQQQQHQTQQQHHHQHQQPQQQQQQQQAWMPQQQMGQMVPTGMNDMAGVQDASLMAYGMPGQDLNNMDLDLMAYGFGDEFMAMNFGLEQGGWAF